MNNERLTRFSTIWNGHRLAYASVGSVPAVLLLHGLGATADFWQAVIDLLAHHYQVIVPDLLGFGFSDTPNVAYSLDQYIAAVEQILIACRMTQLAAIVGHSCGGVIAIGLLARNPSLTTQLALAATPLVSPRFPSRQELLRHPRDRAMLTWMPLAQAVHMTIHMFWPLLRRFPVAPALRGAWVGYMDHTIPSYVRTAAGCLFKVNLDLIRADRSAPHLAAVWPNGPDGSVCSWHAYAHGVSQQPAYNACRGPLCGAHRGMSATPTLVPRVKRMLPCRLSGVDEAELYFWQRLT